LLLYTGGRYALCYRQAQCGTGGDASYVHIPHTCINAWTLTCAMGEGGYGIVRREPDAKAGGMIPGTYTGPISTPLLYCVHHYIIVSYLVVL
jgi:hypothetical protein